MQNVGIRLVTLNDKLYMLVLGSENLSSSNAFVSGVGGLKFKSRASQIERIVLPTARRRCDISLKEAVSPGRNGVGMDPANS